MSTPSHGQELSETEFYHHEETYYGFLHLAKWFIGHVLLLVTALYFVVMHQALAFGIFLVLVALVVLGIGIATAPRAAHEGAAQSDHRIEEGELPSEAAMAADPH